MTQAAPSQGQLGLIDKELTCEDLEALEMLVRVNVAGAQREVGPDQ